MVKILIHLTYKIAAVKDRQSEYKLTALNMYLFLLLQCLAVFVTMKVKSNSDSSYFSISNKIVYSEEVIEIFPNISIVQCLLTLPTLGFFENGSLGMGSKWPPPLKIFNNDVKMLKLVPNLGNHTIFPNLHQKQICDNFLMTSAFLS